MIQAIYDRCYSGGDKAIAAPRGDGKALAIDTSIPTPNGWRKMGELQPGDKVFGGDGKPCNVVAITDVMLDRPCYEVVFADGDRIVADANHEWVVNKRWKESKTIATTKQMHDYGLNVSDGKRKWFDAAWTVDVSDSVEINQQDHRNVIDPYALGVWLGDGNTSDSMMTCHKSEADHYIQNFAKAGIVCGAPKKSNGNAVRFTIGYGSSMTTDRIDEYRRGIALVSGGLSVRQAAIATGAEPMRLAKYTKSEPLPDTSFSTKLRQLGLLGNKHIPDSYLFSSEASRLALLQGLMDTDGSISKRGQCEYVSKLRHLIESVSTLVSSLGIKSGNVMTKMIDGTPYYRLTFTATEKPVFRLQRKLGRQVITNAKCLKTKAIKSITKVDSVPVKCIQVDSADRTYLCGSKFTKTHNSQVSISMVAYALLATPIRFPIFIAQTTKKSSKLFKQLKNKFNNPRKFPEFFGDFPEITACVNALDGAPQRAPKQHVNGIKTDILWTQDKIRLPYIEGCPFSGKMVVYFGLDAAIRGEGDDEDRPDLAVIDDPETREVAFSPTNQHQVIEDMIDGDVAGLAGPNKRISRVVLTTIQNRKCYSYRVTSRIHKATFEGDRYGILSSWPERDDLWQEYIAKRQSCQSSGDRNGKEATQFYLDNMEEMKRGATLTNPYRFVSEKDSDGNPIEVDALQAFYNRVADWGLDRVLAELQNEPKEDEIPESLGINPGLVAGRMSGLAHAEVPPGAKIFFGCDVGKYKLDWVKVAFHGNCVGTVIDYGEWRVIGTDKTSSDEATELAILRALHELRRYALAENRPDFGFIDSGDFTPAIYEFIRQTGAPFVASKGHDDSRISYSGENTEKKRYFDNCRADWQQEQGIWLYNFNAHHWKNEVHQRFTTKTFDDSHQFNEGSLSVWATQDPKVHLPYSQEICAEERQEVFIEGKGLVKKWVVKSKRNHKLDATAMALCAAACMGIKVVPRVQPTRPEPQKSHQPTPQANFRSRQGGWIPKRRY